MLPPSGHIKLENILAIGHALFCTDNSEGWATDTLFVEAVFPASSSTAFLSPLVTDSDVTDSDEMGKKTAELMTTSKTLLVSTLKEANIRQILGIFLMFLSKFTNSRNIVTGGSLGIDFEFTVWDKQQPGRNPATDAAVVLLRKAATLQPLILYELKTSVHPHGPKLM